MSLKLHNSLTRKKEEFVPLEDNKVRMYTCGPTVYVYATIGNLRAYVFSDILRRALMYLGYDVTQVMNVTDVGHLTSDEDVGEDKLELAAQREGRTAWDIARFYEDAFFRDAEKMNIPRADIVCRATEHVDAMINLVRRLVENGYAYETGQAIYFHVPCFTDYSKLSGQSLEDKITAVRAEVQEDPEKKNPADFALWFKAVGRFENHAMQWDSPWGRGFPGWHVECSAMSMKYLGDTLDIHTGGIDHIPVHHTNEIAQSEAATGKQFVRYWVHNNFLKVDGGKMSKSLGNVYTLSDVEERGIKPLAFRYFCLSAVYRATLNFTWDSVAAAQTTVNSLYAFVREAKRSGATGPSPEWTREYADRFRESLEDDLNTPRALAAMWDLIRESNRRQDFSVLAVLYDFDRVLGLDLDRVPVEEELAEDYAALVAERQKARETKDWARADEIRKQLAEAGILLEDRPGGVVWRRAEG
ncbi:MAG: cysteine--tRNA ligase [Armatimonadota bacterium]|nr:cysteine--tRNA ligase [Armatimonadota bacterium]